MTPKERAVMRQALEALEELHYSSGTVVSARKYENATAALREALAEQTEQEPVAWVDLEQWQSGEYDCFTSEKVADYMTPLYTAPVRTKDLTDDEIWDCLPEHPDNTEFARAVIQADRELNK